MKDRTEPKPAKHFVARENDASLLYQGGATENPRTTDPIYTRSPLNAYAFISRAAAERMAAIAAQATGVPHVVTPAPIWL